jgi:hypothetical protein
LRWRLAIFIPFLPLLVGNIYWLMPRADDAVYTIYLDYGFDPARIIRFTSLWTRGVFAIPKPHPRFWSTSWLDQVPRFAGIIGPAITVIGVAALIYAIREHRPALWTLIGSTLGLLAFFYVKHPGELRHHGFFFLVTVAAAWLAAAGSISDRRRRVLHGLLGAIVVVQVTGAAFAVALETRYPFSAARETARYVADRLAADPDLGVVGSPDYIISPVAGYLGRSVRYLNTDNPLSFPQWKVTRQEHVSETVLMDRLGEWREDHPGPALLVLDRELSEGTLAAGLPAAGESRPATVRLVHASGVGTVRDEQYWVYALEPSPGAGADSNS